MQFLSGWVIIRLILKIWKGVFVVLKMQNVLPMGEAWAVVVTGILITFLALAILIGLCVLFSRIVKNVGKKNEPVSAPAPKPIPVQPKTAVAAPAAPASVPQTEDDEVVAVIAAAVAAMSEADGVAYKITGIRKTAPVRAGRSAWALAGLQENTQSF